MKTGVMVQSVERAIAIFKCFTEEKPALRLKDIAGELGLNKSTVHGLLNTLKHYDFLQQDEETQKYRLGLAFLDISSRILNSMDVRIIAHSVIHDLCAKTDETIHLVVMEGTDVVYIDKQEPCQSIRLFTSIGMRYPAYVTAVGKAIIANKPPNEWRKYLPSTLNRLTMNTITDFQIMLDHLTQIRQCGYALDNEENLEGLSCVAAPIFDHHSQVIAAISISGPSYRITEDRIPAFANDVIAAARQISIRLGYQDPEYIAQQGANSPSHKKRCPKVVEN